MKTYKDVVRETFSELKGSDMSPQEKMRVAGKTWRKHKGTHTKKEEEGGGFFDDLKPSRLKNSFNTAMSIVKPISKVANIASMGAIPDVIGMIPKL